MLSPSKESWVYDMEAVLLDFCWQGNLLTESVDSVNASVDLTEENSSWNRKIFISRRRKLWFSRSLLKEIVNFVFNKSTRETMIEYTCPGRFYTRRHREKKNDKDWLQRNFNIKCQKNYFIINKIVVDGFASCESVVIFWYLLFLG